MKSTPIKDLRDGMRDLGVVGEIIEMPPPTRFGDRGWISLCTLRDDTGQVKLSLVDRQISDVSLGSRIRIARGFTHSIGGELVLRAGGIHFSRKIKDFKDGMTSLDVEGEIAETPEWKDIGSGWRKTQCILKDDTGQVKLLLTDSNWNLALSSTYDRVKRGSRIRITHGSVFTLKGELVLHVGGHGTFEATKPDQ
ncbi:MAG TPA: hypothetical protein VGS11_10555 [Candidatus Bathyarchaeia archaeon]|nr:hypothetical protein [Candidatus Bathyarchaeia archaeon]